MTCRYSDPGSHKRNNLGHLQIYSQQSIHWLHSLIMKIKTDAVLLSVASLGLASVRHTNHLIPICKLTVSY